jgi:Predicted outer membrane protein
MCDRTRRIRRLLLWSAGAVCISAAQTSGTATIVGLVTDASGAAIAGASIELLDASSRQVRRQPANDVGQYTVTGLLPANYRVSASAPGFRQSVVPSLIVDVAKSYTLNFSLELGAVTDSIEVKAGAAVELQTLDSTVGSVIKGESLLRMPAINRSAMTFFALQPLVVPTRGTINLGSGQHLTGQVAGARSDQSTFTVDGIDVSDLSSGTNFYAGAAIDFNGPTPMIPVPAESVEEFRLSTTNSNATYHVSAGGQINLITKRGGNDVHGSLYWYLQNNVLNANRWDYNRAAIRRPALHDNRFGGAAGGPVVRNKTLLVLGL